MSTTTKTDDRGFLEKYGRDIFVGILVGAYDFIIAKQQPGLQLGMDVILMVAASRIASMSTEYIIVQDDKTVTPPKQSWVQDQQERLIVLALLYGFLSMGASQLNILGFSKSIKDIAMSGGGIIALDYFAGSTIDEWFKPSTKTA